VRRARRWQRLERKRKSKSRKRFCSTGHNLHARAKSLSIRGLNRVGKARADIVHRWEATLISCSLMKSMCVSWDHRRTLVICLTQCSKVLACERFSCHEIDQNYSDHFLFYPLSVRLAGILYYSAKIGEDNMVLAHNPRSLVLRHLL